MRRGFPPFIAVGLAMKTWIGRVREHFSQFDVVPVHRQGSVATG